MDRVAAFADLMPAHRSIRSYRPEPLPAGLVDRALGRERYLAVGPEMAALWQAHGVESLAQYCTSKIKHDPDCFAEFSQAIEALLRERGFLAGEGS